MNMPFGRHKGTALAELPFDYLRWLVSLDDLREPLRSAVLDELEGRCHVVRSPLPGVPIPDSRRDSSPPAGA